MLGTACSFQPGRSTLIGTPAQPTDSVSWNLSWLKKTRDDLSPNPRKTSEWMTDMRCPGCGAEMHLIEVAPDKTKMVPGYEQHTFECSSCHDRVRQLVFTPRPIEPLSSEETRLSAAWLETLNKDLKATTWHALSKPCRLKATTWHLPSEPCRQSRPGTSRPCTSSGC